jgi:uncharacterized repeat protein (TIGR03803 family)
MCRDRQDRRRLRQRATTLVSFNGTDGAFPNSRLIADAQGDLFGTTTQGGANNDGTVFEIAKTPHGYAGVARIEPRRASFCEASLFDPHFVRP